MRAVVNTFTRCSRTALLGAWLCALSWLLRHDRYEAFLRPEFGWLVGLGAVILLLLVIAEIARPKANRKPSFGGAMRWLILMTPLAYLPVANGVALDSDALEKRWTGFSGNVQTPGPVPVVTSEGLYSVTLEDLCYGAEDYNGRRVTVDGMIKRVPEIAEEFGADACLLYRFLVTCCVADALPAAILLKGNVPADWPDDTWVRAEGTFVLELRREPHDVIRLDAEQVVKIEKPQNPYLY